MPTVSGTSRALPYLAFAAVAYCAIAVNFSWIQSVHNSDTVIPALISIEKYSLFYWSENRFGMLVPLLASPVRDYGWNLLVQSQLIVLAGIGTIVLLDALVVAKREARTVRLTLVGLLLLACYKEPASLVLLLPGSPYLISLSLLFAAFYFLFRRPDGRLRWFLAALLLVLAFWVNLSNIVMAGVTAMFWPARDLPKFNARISLLGLVAAAAAVVVAISWQFPSTQVWQLLPAAEWPGSFAKMLSNVKVTMRDTVVASTIAAGAVIEAFRIKRGHYSPLHAITVGAIAQTVVTTGLRWVALNAYDARYIAGPLFVLTVLALLVLISPIAKGLEDAAGANVAVAICCLMAVIIVTRIFGWPSQQRAFDDIRRATADFAPPPQLACTHIIGSYWFVWEAIFNDRLRTGERRVWAVSHRSDATRDDWTAMPVADRKYCALCSDPLIEYTRNQEHVGQLTKEAEFNGVCVFRELAE